MLKIILIAVGKLKEGYLRDAVQSYSRDIRKKVPFEILEVLDEGVSVNSSASEVEGVRVREGKSILSHVKAHSFVFALDIQGKRYRTSELKNMLQEISNSGYREIIFIIGGSNGLSSQVLDRANVRISFSPMTFPHQLMRVLLCEQIERCL